MNLQSLYTLLFNKILAPIPVSRIDAIGTPDSTTFLRGDGNWEIGPVGPPGADGADGADGVDGADGADGAIGPPGPTSHRFECGVATLSPGANTVLLPGDTDVDLTTPDAAVVVTRTTGDRSYPLTAAIVGAASFEIESDDAGESGSAFWIAMSPV